MKETIHVKCPRCGVQHDHPYHIFNDPDIIEVSVCVLCGQMSIFDEDELKMPDAWHIKMLVEHPDASEELIEFLNYVTDAVKADRISKRVKARYN